MFSTRSRSTNQFISLVEMSLNTAGDSVAKCNLTNGRPINILSEIKERSKALSTGPTVRVCNSGHRGSKLWLVRSCRMGAGSVNFRER